MNLYKVFLRDNREAIVTAQRYRREGNQYVFESDHDEDVQFFVESEVIGVQLLPPDTFEPKQAMSY